jgi:hypothetical protein
VVVPLGGRLAFESFLSDVRNARAVNDEARIDRQALAEEMERYLAAVDVFRALGCEPVWRPELESARPLPEDFAGVAEAAAALGRRSGWPHGSS